MITFETDLYVDKVNLRGEYDQKIDCRADQDESKAKYPQKLSIVIRKKNFDKFDSDIGEGDKIHVKLYPSTSTGVSKTSGRPYSITSLIVMDLRIVERVKAPEQPTAEDPEIDNLPF